MWLRKRVLKKERSVHARKRLMVVSVVLASCGIILILLGFFLQKTEPLFASPLPLLDPIGKSVSFEKESEVFFKENNINVQSVSEAQGKSYVIKLKDGGEVIVTDEKDTASQLASLQRIVQQLTMEGKKIKRLDLRFDRPVLVLQ